LSSCTTSIAGAAARHRSRLSRTIFCTTTPLLSRRPVSLTMPSVPSNSSGTAFACIHQLGPKIRGKLKIPTCLCHRYRIKTACGKAGTGYLFDTHALHRGRPQGPHDNSRTVIIAECLLRATTMPRMDPESARGKSSDLNGVCAVWSNATRYHEVSKCALVRELGLQIPCPSGDQFFIKEMLP
jgi:hypothetical protein